MAAPMIGDVNFRVGVSRLLTYQVHLSNVFCLNHFRIEIPNLEEREQYNLSLRSLQTFENAVANLHVTMKAPNNRVSWCFCFKNMHRASLQVFYIGSSVGSDYGSTEIMRCLPVKNTAAPMVLFEPAPAQWHLLQLHKSQPNRLFWTSLDCPKK